MFNLFKKKDPICGMKQEKGKGIIDKNTGNWFCSKACYTQFKEQVKQQEKSVHNKPSCCH